MRAGLEDRTMKESRMTKTDWVALLREGGMKDDGMHRWHTAFEQRWPEAHQELLAWLNLPPAEIDRIRDAARRAAP
jgi:hypothetical protein